MARDEYTFSELAKHEVRGPGVTLSSPENAELVKRLQDYWANKASDREFKRHKVASIDRPVIVTMKYGKKKRYPNARALAFKLGYEHPESVLTCIRSGIKMRHGYTAVFADEDGE